MNIEKTFQKAMVFLQQPAKAFGKEKTSEVMDAFVYMLMLSIVTAVLSGLLTLWLGAALAVITIISIYIGGIVFSVIAGLWLHLWAYIFGAKKGLHQTLKTVFYGGTPTYLLGWIPLIGMLFSLWSLYLQWVGLKTLQGMPGDKAAFSIVIAFLIPLLVLGALVMIGFALFSSMTGMEGMPSTMFPAGFEMPQ